MYDIFSTYTRVSGSVSIHNLSTVAPRYRELLALLVYLTRPSSSAPGRHNTRVGAFDVVGDGGDSSDGGGDSGSSSWSLEVGGMSLSMPRTVATATAMATAPAFGGV